VPFGALLAFAAGLSALIAETAWLPLVVGLVGKLSRRRGFTRPDDLNASVANNGKARSGRIQAGEGSAEDAEADGTLL